MKILVTGFDPFGGEPINPAIESVKKLPDNIAGAQIIKLEIPTVKGKSIKKIEKAIEEHNPDVILSIGQAGGRFDISVERVGINLDDFRIPDNEGNQTIDEPIFPDGENAYFVDLPVKAMVKNIQKNKIPASVSYTAGTFICNHVLYGTLYLINKKYKNKKVKYFVEYIFDLLCNLYTIEVLFSFIRFMSKKKLQKPTPEQLLQEETKKLKKQEKLEKKAQKKALKVQKKLEKEQAKVLKKEQKKQEKALKKEQKLKEKEAKKQAKNSKKSQKKLADTIKIFEDTTIITPVQARRASSKTVTSTEKTAETTVAEKTPVKKTPAATKAPVKTTKTTVSRKTPTTRTPRARSKTPEANTAQ